LLRSFASARSPASIALTTAALTAARSVLAFAGRSPAQTSAASVSPPIGNGSTQIVPFRRRSRVRCIRLAPGLFIFDPSRGFPQLLLMVQSAF
jgi:hypothetical protein